MSTEYKECGFETSMASNCARSHTHALGRAFAVSRTLNPETEAIECNGEDDVTINSASGVTICDCRFSPFERCQGNSKRTHCDEIHFEPTRSASVPRDRCSPSRRSHDHNTLSDEMLIRHQDPLSRSRIVEKQALPLSCLGQLAITYIDGGYI